MTSSISLGCVAGGGCVGGAVGVTVPVVDAVGVAASLLECATAKNPTTPAIAATASPPTSSGALLLPLRCDSTSRWPVAPPSVVRTTAAGAEPERGCGGR